MIISIQLIRELRERTGGISIMACKKALEAAAGNIEEALGYLQKQGQFQAQKKSSRLAAEGLIGLKVQDDGKAVALVEINCETDFVAREASFLEFVSQVAQLILKNKVTDRKTLLNSNLIDQNVEQVRQFLVAKLGENIQIRRFIFLTSDCNLGFYLHAGRIGGVVELVGGDKFLAKDLAMQVVANDPSLVSDVSVPKSDLEAQVSSDITNLLDQAFIKDPSIKVSKVLEGAGAKVLKFVRFALGEASN